MIIMRTLKAASLLVVLAIFYVWQNTYVFKIAYETNKKSGIYKDLLEKNTLLRYNINTKKSSADIAQNFLYKYNDLRIADSVVVLKTKETQQKRDSFLYSQLNSKENKLFRFLFPSAKAEQK